LQPTGDVKIAPKETFRWRNPICHSEPAGEESGSTLWVWFQKTPSISVCWMIRIVLREPASSPVNRQRFRPRSTIRKQSTIGADVYDTEFDCLAQSIAAPHH